MRLELELKLELEPPAVFKITLPCSGKVTDEVDVQVLINILGWLPPADEFDLAGARLGGASSVGRDSDEGAAVEQSGRDFGGSADEHQVARALAAANSAGPSLGGGGGTADGAPQPSSNGSAQAQQQDQQMQADEASAGSPAAASAAAAAAGGAPQMRLVSHTLAIKRKKICTMHPVHVQPMARTTGAELLRPPTQPILNAQLASPAPPAAQAPPQQPAQSPPPSAQADSQAANRWAAQASADSAPMQQVSLLLSHSESTGVEQSAKKSMESVGERATSNCSEKMDTRLLTLFAGNFAFARSLARPQIESEKLLQSPLLCSPMPANTKPLTCSFLSLFYGQKIQRTTSANNRQQQQVAEQQAFGEHSTIGSSPAPQVPPLAQLQPSAWPTQMRQQHQQLHANSQLSANSNNNNNLQQQAQPAPIPAENPLNELLLLSGNLNGRQSATSSGQAAANPILFGLLMVLSVLVSLALIGLLLVGQQHSEAATSAPKRPLDK